MAFSVPYKHARVPAFTENVLPVRKLAPPASFRLAAARALTTTRNVLQARRIAPPQSFSRADAGGVNDDYDDDDDDDKKVHTELGFRFLQNQVRGRRDWVVTLNPRPVFYRKLITKVAAGGLDDDDQFFISRWGKEGKWPEYLCKFRYPKSSMREDEGSLTYRFEVPGCGKEDIKVTVENYQLKIINLKKKESGAEDDQGDDAGLMMMLLVWPCWFKANLITTDVKLGVLNVVVPKADGKCFNENDKWWSSAWKHVGMLDNMEEVILGAD